jgi:hypothetical protein
MLKLLQTIRYFRIAFRLGVTPPARTRVERAACWVALHW